MVAAETILKWQATEGESWGREVAQDSEFIGAGDGFEVERLRVS